MWNLRSMQNVIAIALLALQPGTMFQYFVKADIDGDGKSDLVGLAPGGPPFTVTVLPGNGSGKFVAAKRTTVTGFDTVVFTSMTIGDVNGDGRPDVAFLGQHHVTGSAALGVMLGNGDGTFQAPRVTALPSGITPISITTADFNGNGKLDIAVGTASEILVLPGNGDGTFAAPITTLVGTRADCIATDDLNNDGKADVVVQANGSGAIPVGYRLLGKGDGTFQSPIALDYEGECRLLRVLQLRHQDFHRR